MAEALFRHAVKDRGDYRVLSAGIGALDGQPPSLHAVRALQEVGLDVAGKRSRQLTRELVQEADYVFGMTQGHVDAVSMLYPQAAEKVFLTREFDEAAGPFDKEILDPIGGSYDVYVRCRDQIQKAIPSMIKFIEQNPVSLAGRVPTAKIQSVVLGADHRGFALKEALKVHLQQLGLKVQDIGVTSRTSCDSKRGRPCTPDFAGSP